jgi:AcrR family transcriptional regulator
MTVEGKRTYRSGLREAQARQTRTLIVSAAAALFVELGFGATTIQAVADAAGVSRKTVFSSVGGKVELIKLAYDHAIGGDDEPISMRDRPQVQQLRATNDPATMLDRLAAVITDANARIAGIYRALQGAAEIDTEARALFEDLQRQRLTGARFHAEHLAALGALRQDLTVDLAVDIVWLYLDPTPFHQLVEQRAWTPARYQTWLSNALQAQLLPD